MTSYPAAPPKAPRKTMAWIMLKKINFRNAKNITMNKEMLAGFQKLACFHGSGPAATLLARGGGSPCRQGAKAPPREFARLLWI
jgi:hypothetical protein